MRKILTLLVLASALPLVAQDFEVSALYTWNKPKSGTFSGGGNNYDFTPDTWKAAGLRFGYTFAKVGTAEFQANTTLQFNNSESYTAKYNGVTSPVGPLLKEGYKYWGLGVAVNWNTPVLVGVGLEYRSEKLEFDGTAVGAPDQSTTYGRPWLRGNVGYAFTTSSSMRPFVALEVAFPLTSSSPDYNQLVANNWESLSKGVAPKLQYGLNAGIRF